ncbi:acyltransferase family protein [Flavihumibacter profundi]|uniref:acyltransferase family protein n=1 Tax=Flavihumibacter profundi TaxID=2716883 RepID=UPI001CC40E6E|nr:heparan-alpha-glucosaminide N-acetyltransferase domain-containing protein [Flavihumibacter profundi]MBZ5858888.1 DUF5009 domain-containing protein [Flavihumibacter profundi]
MNPTTSERFLALDVFRGMTICFMIIVNTPGNSATSFAPLLHAQWNGFTPTDLVFPSFLFAVGNAIAFVMPKWEGLNQSAVLAKILKRTVIIFGLGFLMYWFPFIKWDGRQLLPFPFSETRVFGVLQRIALCYGFASLLIYFLKPRTTYMLSALFLMAYWILCFTLGDPSDPLSMEGNAGLRLDKWLLGDAHLFHGEGVSFEPEGLLSTLPAIVNVVIGFWAGDLVRRKGKTWETLAILLLAGSLLMFCAYCWNGVFPVNKKLWTSSFVLLTTGLDCMIIAGIIYLVDFLGRIKWTGFFTIMGKNPLFIYLLSEILATVLNMLRTSSGDTYYRAIYDNVFRRFGAYTGSLLFAVCYMLTCWLVGWWLDKKKIYIRV